MKQMLPVISTYLLMKEQLQCTTVQVQQLSPYSTGTIVLVLLVLVPVLVLVLRGLIFFMSIFFWPETPLIFVTKW
jgi:hypothetical protein